MRTVMKPTQILVVLLALAAVVVFAVTLWEDTGWQRRQQLNADLHTTTTKIKEAEEKAEFLSKQINAIRNDQYTQEAVIREELGYLRDGDIILEIPQRRQP